MEPADAAGVAAAPPWQLGAADVAARGVADAPLGRDRGLRLFQLGIVLVLVGWWAGLVAAAWWLLA